MIAMYPCGCPRTPINTYYNGTTACCRRCKLKAVKARQAKQRAFRCGCPMTPANTYFAANGNRRCLTHKREYARIYDAEKRGKPAYPMPPCLLQTHWTKAATQPNQKEIP